MKRILSVVFVLVFAVTMFASVIGFAAATPKPKATAAPVLVAGPSSTLMNGDFAKSASGKIPDNWQFDAFENKGTVAYSPKGSEPAFVTISSDTPTDARLVQKVILDKNSTYKFSCEIKASGFKDLKKNGAVLSVIGSLLYSNPIFDAKEWKESEVYIVTSSSDSAYGLSVGIGGYSSNNAGTASFRNLKLKKITTAPPKNASVITLTAPSAPNAPSSNNTKLPESSSSIMWIIIIVAVLLVGGVAYYLIVMKKSTNASGETTQEEIEEDDSEETVETFEDENVETKKETSETKEDDLL